jgi:hypothetical protein
MRKVTMLMTCVCLALTGFTVRSTTAQAATDADTGVADTGPAPQQAQADPLKAAGQATAMQQLAAYDSGTSQPDGCEPGCPPASHTLTISHFYYEGEGNGGATYTCGPASTRTS